MKHPRGSSRRKCGAVLRLCVVAFLFVGVVDFFVGRLSSSSSSVLFGGIGRQLQIYNRDVKSPQSKRQNAMQQHQYAVEMELELELRQRKESIVAARRAEANEAELEMLMVGQEDQEEVDRERIKAGEPSRAEMRLARVVGGGAERGYELHAPNMSATKPGR